MKLAAFCLTILIASMAPIVRGQDAQLSGYVLDKHEAVIPTATLTLTNQATSGTRTTESNASGVYTFPGLQPGTYDVAVAAKGFKQLNKTGIKLDVAARSRLDFTLEVGSVNEAVTVSSDALLMNTSDASVSTVVDQKFIQNMPLNGRSLQSLITLSPGVVITTPPYGSRGDRGEFSVNGQRTETNYFTVDGASGNFGTGANYAYGAAPAGATPNSSALGTTHGMISLDALQEFRIQTSSYAAEYGRSPGAQISLTSRAGTNEYHGTLFNYFRNEKLDANNWFNNRAGIGKTPLRQNDFGGTFGGPLILPGYNGRNRTFFFASYEGLRLRLPQGASTIQVPELDLRRGVAAPLQAILNTFPAPNGGAVLLPGSNGVLQPSGLAYYTAAVSDPATLDNVSIRLDQRFSDRVNVFGRFQTSPSTYDDSNALRYVLRSPASPTVFYVGGDWILSPHVVNQLRFNSSRTIGGSKFMSSKYNLDGTPTGEPYTTDDFFPETHPTYSDGRLNLQWGGNPDARVANNRTEQTQWNLVETLSFTRGMHSLKFGGDYRQTTNPKFGGSLLATYRFDSIQSLLANSADAVTVGTLSFGQKPRYKNYSFFAQDEWRVSPRLTLSLGLRWDINPAPRNANEWQPPVLRDVETFTLAPPGSSLYSTDYLGLGPRVGVAYRLFGASNRETVLRAGYGIFFDTGHASTTTAYVNGGFSYSKIFTAVPFPLPSQLYQVPNRPILTPPFTGNVTAFNPNLKLPYSDHWNVTVEQRLGSGRSLTMAYVGSAGHRLHHILYKTAPVELVTGGTIRFVDNVAYSNYHSVQVKFQQTVWHGLQVLSSYTWSHAIDIGSSDFDSNDFLRKGDSDYDQRQVFQTAITYDLPRAGGIRAIRALVNGWGIDGRISLNTAFPLDPYIGTAYLESGLRQVVRPDVVPGQPYYVSGPQYPGGKAINYNALRRSTNPSSFGNMPRNFFRLFGASQANVAIRRDFRMAENIQLQFRGEAFNLLNHPNFGSVQLNHAAGPATFGQTTRTLNVALGGLNALYQLGGPRSLQLALKLVF